MVAHSPRAFPWEIKPPVGIGQVTGKRRRRARGRRSRPRICLRKGCRRKYRPRCHNQRYCQDPECLRKVRRWHAARRKARHRQDADVKIKHAQEEKARRQLAKSASQNVENPKLAPARGHAAQTFFALPLCDRPGCHEHPASALSQLNFRVNRFQFRSGVVDLHLPVDTALSGVDVCRPSRGFLAECCDIRESAA